MRFAWILLAWLTLASTAAALDNVIVLVRHAEKMDDSRDAELSETGRVRAEVLAALLKDMKIDTIFSSTTSGRGIRRARSRKRSGSSSSSTIRGISRPSRRSSALQKAASSSSATATRRPASSVSLVVSAAQTSPTTSMTASISSSPAAAGR